MASRSSFQSGTRSSEPSFHHVMAAGAHVMAQAEVEEARHRRRDRVERARPPALGVSLPKTSSAVM